MNIILAIGAFVVIWNMEKILSISLRWYVRSFGVMLFLVATFFMGITDTVVALIAAAATVGVIRITTAVVAAILNVSASARRALDGGRPYGWGRSRYYDDGYIDGCGRWHDYR